MAHYLDNAATTPLDPEVLEALQAALRDCYGNPSSLHPPGVAAARLLNRARDLLEGMLGARRIVFTGGGTEATNLAMHGHLLGKLDTTRGAPGRILFGKADHPATTATAKRLERFGFEAVSYEVDAAGHPVLEALAEQLDTDVRFVSFLHGHNELGTLLELRPLVDLVREKAPRAHVHVDIVQAFAKVPFDLDRADVDSATIAAHKIHGPKGVGALALGARAHPEAFVTGGGQEDGLRSGTENVPGIHAFALAAERWISRMSEESGRIEALRDDCEAGLRSRIPELVVLGDTEARLPHVLPIAIPGLVGEVLLHHLDDDEIYVSTGSACSQHEKPKKRESAELGLASLGLDAAVLRGMLRISFGRLSTAEDVEAITSALPRHVERLGALGL